MTYRKFTADRIYDGKEWLENKVLISDAVGNIREIVPLPEAGEDVEVFEGILCPGFINCHCHIELSYLKGFIPSGKGLVDFLISIVKNRSGFTGDKLPPIVSAEEEMWRNGISGVADICNTNDAIPVKLKSGLHWHSFLEVINFYDRNLEQQVSGPSTLLEEHRAAGLSASLVPHAPYSVSEKTMQVINERSRGEIISIHNQETKGEDELFLKGKGDFIRLYTEFGNPASPFPVSRKTSLQTWLPRFTNEQTILLVHNSYISEEDVVFAKEHADRHGLTIAYCLCPNANLYIENNLPPVDLFLKHNCKVVLGTDSYSSNWQLSIAHEMQTLKKHFPALTVEILLNWGTSNGAEIMQWTNLGRFETGKKPGIVLTNEDFSSSKRIL